MFSEIVQQIHFHSSAYHILYRQGSGLLISPQTKVNGAFAVHKVKHVYKTEGFILLDSYKGAEYLPWPIRIGVNCPFLKKNDGFVHKGQSLSKWLIHLIVF